MFSESFSPLGPHCPGGTVTGAGGILDVVGLANDWKHAVWGGVDVPHPISSLKPLTTAV